MAAYKTPISYITWPMRLVLIITGSIFIQYKNLQLAVISVAILGYIPVFYATIDVAMDSSSNASMMSDSISMFLMFFSPFCITVITILHKPVFIHAIELINDENDAEFIELLNKRLLHLLLVLMSVAMVCEVPYVISTIIMAIVYNVKSGTPESLIFPLYVPWQYDTTISYFLTMLLELVMLMHPGFMEYSMALTLGSFYIYIDSKFTNLLASLQNIKDNEGKVFLPSHNQTLTRANPIDSDFIEIINSYQDWKNTSKQLISYTADYSCVVLFCVMICTVLNIANLTEADISMVFKIKNFSVLAYMFAHLYLVCFLGEYFQNADDEFRNALYGISWYKQPANLRKTATMIMMQTQTPMTIKAYGMISVNKGLTLKMLRNIYSLWNLYRNTYKRS